MAKQFGFRNIGGGKEDDKRYTLQKLSGETDFTDEEFDAISELKVGEAVDIPETEGSLQCQVVRLQ